MKILHINVHDTGGGAAIAARRHCEAQKASGIDAYMLCLSSVKPASWIHTVATKTKSKIFGKVNRFLNSLGIKGYEPYGTWSNSNYGFNLAKHPAVKGADVVVLHWINSGFLSIKGIENLLKTGKTVIWFLHDMWPLTGGCHYSLGCDRFTKECGNCPLLKNGKGASSHKDPSNKQFLKKFHAWSRYNNLCIMTPSKWLADCAKKSPIFKDCKINVLRNPVDVNLFHPFDKMVAREALNLPKDKKIILFGADSATSPYKGWPYLASALEYLDPSEIECMVFGNSEEWNFPSKNGLKIHTFGRLADPIALMLIYNAADLFVTPSQADNYPNVLIEAMACGLPCTGFDIGGIPEIIQDGVSGIITNEISLKALAVSILQTLKEKEKLSKGARNQVVSNNSYERYRFPCKLTPEVI